MDQIERCPRGSASPDLYCGHISRNLERTKQLGKSLISVLVLHLCGFNSIKFIFPLAPQNLRDYVTNNRADQHWCVRRSDQEGRGRVIGGKVKVKETIISDGGRNWGGGGERWSIFDRRWSGDEPTFPQSVPFLINYTLITDQKFWFVPPQQMHSAVSNTLQVSGGEAENFRNISCWEIPPNHLFSMESSKFRNSDSDFLLGHSELVPEGKGEGLAMFKIGKPQLWTNFRHEYLSWPWLWVIPTALACSIPFWPILDSKDSISGDSILLSTAPSPPWIDQIFGPLWGDQIRFLAIIPFLIHFLFHLKFSRAFPLICPAPSSFSSVASSPCWPACSSPCSWSCLPSSENSTTMRRTNTTESTPTTQCSRTSTQWSVRIRTRHFWDWSDQH